MSTMSQPASPQSHIPDRQAPGATRPGRPAGTRGDPIRGRIPPDAPPCTAEHQSAHAALICVAAPHLAVSAEHVPTDLVRGSRVDVWVIGEDRRSRAAAELVLGDVLILDAPVVSDSFASATSRQLVLAVPDDDEESLGQVLAASGDNRVRVVGRG